MTIEVTLLLFMAFGFLVWAICKRIERIEVRLDEHESWHREPNGKVEVLQGKIQKSTDDAAAWDIFASLPWNESTQKYEPLIVNPGEQIIVPTGLKTRMFGADALVLDRSGLAAKFRITRRAGVIDEQYPDEWGVVLVNEGRYPYQVNHGDRVAQAMFVEKPCLEVVANGGEVIILDQVREGGFGSTGK